MTSGKRNTNDTEGKIIVTESPGVDGGNGIEGTSNRLQIFI